MMDTQTQMFYTNILQAAQNYLHQNIGNMGQMVGAQAAQAFAQEFMAIYTPSSNQMTQQNAQHLYQYVANMGQQFGGSFSPQQLFEVVGGYISQTFDRWRQRMASSQPGGMMGNYNGFGGGNQMNRGMQPMGGFNSRPDPTDMLGSDPSIQRGQPAPTVAPAPVQAPAAAAPVMTVPASATIYVANPLDDINNDNIEFNKVTSNQPWGDQRNNAGPIIIGERSEIKTRDSRFTVRAASAYHRDIMDDPMKVAEDFFKYVDDSILGSIFLCNIYYNHLDIIDVPTKDFLTVREKCIHAIEQDSDTLLHKKLIEELKTMPQIPYEALTTYLLGHINRSLHLAARLSEKPSIYVKLNSFKEVDELLSSSFQHSFTAHPSGRYKLEKIVTNTLWNVLVKNAGVLFDNKETIPTHALQTSPAFPYSISGVYPNKFAIPTNQDQDLPVFMDKLTEKELSRKTYLLTRRRVTITNILGKKILGSIGKVPQLLNTPIAQIFKEAKLALPLSENGQVHANIKNPVKPYADEDYPTEIFQRYVDDPKTYQEEQTEYFERMPPIELPVDQTIFAVQYGVPPQKYMTAVDVFTGLDDTTKMNDIILSHKAVNQLTLTE